MNVVGATTVGDERTAGQAGTARETRTGRAVTDASFEAEVLQNPRPVIVEYWAQWCAPCKMVAPVLESIAADYAGQAELVTMNVDENPATASRFGVLHVPTISVFAGGEVVRQVVGAKSRNALLREFGDVLDTADGLS